MNNFDLFIQQMKIRVVRSSESSSQSSEFLNTSFKISKDDISFFSDSGKPIVNFHWSDVSFSEDESSLYVLESSDKKKLLEISGRRERLTHLKERIQAHQSDASASEEFKAGFLNFPWKFRRVHLFLFVWMTLFILAEIYVYISAHGVPIHLVSSSGSRPPQAGSAPVSLCLRRPFDRHLSLDCLPRQPSS